MLTSNEIDLVVLQETHAADEKQLDSRGKIPGYELLGATYHHAYGNATYVRNSIENAYHISSSTHNDIHAVVSKIGNIEITNVYKPPNTTWPRQVIELHPHPGPAITRIGNIGLTMKAITSFSISTPKIWAHSGLLHGGGTIIQICALSAKAKRINQYHPSVKYSPTFHIANTDQSYMKLALKSP